MNNTVNMETSHDTDLEYSQVDSNIQDILHGDKDGIIQSSDLLKLTFPPIQWLIEDYLNPGLTILYGQPKIGKSLLALQICKAISTGTEIFSKSAKKGKVLFVPLEGNPRATFERMGNQMWLDTSSVGLLFQERFYELYETLDGYGCERFLEVIRMRGYDLVIIDTLSKSMNVDQLCSEEMTRVLSPFQHFSGSKEISIIFIDHEAKKGDTPYGSVAKQAIADNIWRLYEDYGQYGYRLSMVGRNIPNDETLVLQKQSGTGLWQCSGSDNNPKITEQHQKIVDFIENNGKSTCQTISEGIDEPRSNTHNRLQVLANKEVITRVEETNGIFYILKDRKLL